MRIALISILLLLLSGCAAGSKTHPVWIKPGTTQEDLDKDMGQCQTKASSTPGIKTWDQFSTSINSCMRDKGWRLEIRPVPKKEKE
jgi:hypothetical protein